MSLLHLPHHDGSDLHVSQRSPALRDEVTVRVRVPAASGTTRVHVRTTPDAEPAYTAASIERRGTDECWWAARIRVHNPVTGYRFLLDGGPGGYRWLTQAGVVDHDVPDDTDFRLVAHPAPPDWVADQVLYQIFPDRFADSGRPRPWPDWARRAAWDEPVATTHPDAMRQLYGGDLPGIEAHLDHLVELGVTGIYLNPIFPASENHRYCATDFSRVDPFLGGDDALVSLSRAVHARGMRLIGDLTVNHSGDQHVWFRAARADPAAPERAFYLWEEYPHRYESWAGVPNLPKFDHRDAELRRRLYEGPDAVAGRWLRPPFDLDGWRVDAANVAGRSGALDGTRDLARSMAATVRSARPDGYLLAEHCHDASADLQGDGWHGTMSYAGFTRPVWSWLVRPDTTLDFLGMPVPVPRLGGAAVAATIDAFRARVPWRTTLHNVNLLGSHDTARFRFVAGDRARAHVGIAFLLTSPGVPSVYYGDELGLAGADNETGREPVPWDRPDTWDHETLAWTRELIRLRRAHPALRRGGFRWAHVGEEVLVFLRETRDERVLVQLARAPHPPVVLPLGPLGGVPEPLLSDRPARVGDGVVELPADGPSARLWRVPAP